MGESTFCGVEGCPFDVDGGPSLHVMVTDTNRWLGSDTFQADLYVCTRHRKAMAQPIVDALTKAAG